MRKPSAISACAWQRAQVAASFDQCTGDPALACGTAACTSPWQSAHTATGFAPGPAAVPWTLWSKADVCSS